MFLCGGRIYRLLERMVSLKVERWFDNNISMEVGARKLRKILG
jgi:hypothetical protein